MYEYIKNILPKIQQFSKDLDTKELIKDKQWVLIDDNGDRATYIFQANGRLIVSLSGDAKIGTWEYVSPAKSLLLTVGDRKTFLSFSFFNNALFILKKDNDSEIPWILVNKNVIPDLNIEKYLNSLIAKAKEENLEVELENGMTLQIQKVTNPQSVYFDYKVTCNGMSVDDGVYKIKDMPKLVRIQNSKIVKYLHQRKYQTDHGELIVQQNEHDNPVYGDRASLTGNPKPSGTFIIFTNNSNLKKIIINDGIISIVKFNYDWIKKTVAFWVLFGVILIVLAFSGVFNNTNITDSPALVSTTDNSNSDNTDSQRMSSDTTRKSVNYADSINVDPGDNSWYNSSDSNAALAEASRDMVESSNQPDNSNYQFFHEGGFKVQCDCQLKLNSAYIEAVHLQNPQKSLVAYVCAENENNPELGTIVNINIFDEARNYANLSPAEYSFLEGTHLAGYADRLKDNGFDFKYVQYKKVTALEYTFDQMGVPTKSIYFIKNKNAYLLQVATKHNLITKYNSLIESFTFL